MSPDAELCPTPGHVLIVEDDVLIRVLLADELRDAGLRVIEAANADEALSIFEAGAQVDLLFTDVQMPGSMDGVELARRIKTIHPALPIILTSGNAGASAARSSAPLSRNPMMSIAPSRSYWNSSDSNRVGIAMVNKACVMIVEADILVRHPLAEYLRECGYKVIETFDADEARQLLGGDLPSVEIDIVLADANDAGDGRFWAGRWDTRVLSGCRAGRLLAGSIAGAAEKAGDICKEGPALDEAHDHKQVLEHIHRLVAARDRCGAGRSRHRREGGAGDRVWT